MEKINRPATNRVAREVSVSPPFNCGVRLRSAPYPPRPRVRKQNKVKRLSRFRHSNAVDRLMTTVLILVLICLVGSALLGFRGYWSRGSRSPTSKGFRRVHHRSAQRPSCRDERSRNGARDRSPLRALLRLRSNGRLPGRDLRSIRHNARRNGARTCRPQGSNLRACSATTRATDLFVRCNFDCGLNRFFCIILGWGETQMRALLLIALLFSLPGCASLIASSCGPSGASQSVQLKTRF
jgi:hypothetical protein